jgi:hypothetical protein
VSAFQAGAHRKHGKRWLVVSVAVGEPVSANLRLVSSAGRPMAIQGDELAAGSHVLRLSIPRGVRPGRYAAELTVADGTASRTLTTPVAVPRLR